MLQRLHLLRKKLFYTPKEFAALQETIATLSDMLIEQAVETEDVEEETSLLEIPDNYWYDPMEIMDTETRNEYLREAKRIGNSHVFKNECNILMNNTIENTFYGTDPINDEHALERLKQGQSIRMAIEAIKYRFMRGLPNPEDPHEERAPENPFTPLDNH